MLLWAMGFFEIPPVSQSFLFQLLGRHCESCTIDCIKNLVEIGNDGGDELIFL